MCLWRTSSILVLPGVEGHAKYWTSDGTYAFPVGQTDVVQ